MFGSFKVGFAIIEILTMFIFLNDLFFWSCYISPGEFIEVVFFVKVIGMSNKIDYLTFYNNMNIMDQDCCWHVNFIQIQKEVGFFAEPC